MIHAKLQLAPNFICAGLVTFSSLFFIKLFFALICSFVCFMRREEAALHRTENLRLQDELRNNRCVVFEYQQRRQFQAKNKIGSVIFIIIILSSRLYLNYHLLLSTHTHTHILAGLG